MKATVPLGRWAGVPVGANWSVLLTLGLLTDLVATAVVPVSAPGTQAAAAWVSGLVVAVVFLCCLLAHELAHAGVAGHRGVAVGGVVLWALGGATTFDTEPRTPKDEAAVAAAGPATSLLLGLVFLAAAAVAGSGPVGACLLWLALTNAVLAVFNALPAGPLDGGRVLHAWLWHRHRDRAAATATVGRVGKVLGWTLVALGTAEVMTTGAVDGLWLCCVGWFLAVSSTVESANARLCDVVADTTVGEAMTTDPVFAPGWWTVAAFAEHVAATRLRHRVYPVRDFHGATLGVVCLADLAGTADPRTRRVADVARAVTDRERAATDEPLVDVLGRARLRPGRDAVLVFEGGQLRGLLTAGDVARTLELARLGERPPHHRHELSG